MEKEKNKIKEVCTKISMLMKKYLYLYIKNKSIKIQVNIGQEGSCTDTKNFVQLSVPEKDYKELSWKELIRTFLFLMYHEGSHILFTDAVVYEKTVKDMVSLWQSEAKKEGRVLIPDFGEKVAHDLINCAEDGRIEVMGTNKEKAFIAYRNFVRIPRWQKYDMSEIYNEDNKNCLTALRNILLTQATMSVPPKGFYTLYKKEDSVYESAKELEPLVEKFVVTPTCEESSEIMLEIAEIFTPYIIKELTLTEEEYEKIMKNIKEFIETLEKDLKDYLEGLDEENAGNEKNYKAGNGKKEKGSSEAKRNPVLSKPSEEGDEEGEEKGEAKGTGEEGESKEKEEKGTDSKSSSSHNSSPKKEGAGDTEDKSGGEGADEEDSPENDDIDGQENMDDLIDKALSEISNSAEDDLYSKDRKMAKEYKEIEKSFEKAEYENRGELTEEDESAISKLGVPAYPDRIEFKEDKRRYNLVPCQNKNAVKYGRKNSSVIKNIIKSKSRPTLTGMYEGVIDNQRLGMFVSGESNVFLQEGQKVDPDMAVYILVDNSGSMIDKFKETWDSLIIFEESLKNTGIVFKIATFSEVRGGKKGYTELHHLIKDWDENDTTKSYSESFVSAGYRPEQNNYDAYAIAIATRQLLQRTESQKLLFVLSDGQPAGWQDNSLYSVNKVVREARKKGVFVGSFFFGSENFITSNFETYKVMYEQYIVGCTPDNISKHIVNLIKKKVDK